MQRKKLISLTDRNQLFDLRRFCHKKIIIIIRLMHPRVAIRNLYVSTRTFSSHRLFDPVARKSRRRLSGPSVNEEMGCDILGFHVTSSKLKNKELSILLRF